MPQGGCAGGEGGRRLSADAQSAEHHRGRRAWYRNEKGRAKGICGSGILDPFPPLQTAVKMCFHLFQVCSLLRGIPVQVEGEPVAMG